jgi:hypothetical protein
MRSKADELRLSVVMGPRQGLRLVRGMRRALTEEEQDKVAGAIVGAPGAEQLEDRAGAACGGAWAVFGAEVTRVEWTAVNSAACEGAFGHSHRSPRSRDFP